MARGHRNKTRWVHCDNCKRNKLHDAHGLCRKCYRRLYYSEICDEATRERHFEKERLRSQGYREANPDQINATNRRYRDRNRERVREWGRVAYAQDPAAGCAKVHRRRALVAGATTEFVDEAAIYERDGYMCLYCGATEDLTLDHIVALNNGGPHCEDNLVVACRRCNASKGTRPLEEWLQTQPKAIAWLF